MMYICWQLYRRACVVVSLVLCGYMFASGCGQPPVSGPCQKDLDCPGSQICIAGKCQFESPSEVLAEIAGEPHKDSGIESLPEEILMPELVADAAEYIPEQSVEIVPEIADQNAQDDSHEPIPEDFSEIIADDIPEDTPELSTDESIQPPICQEQEKRACYTAQTGCVVAAEGVYQCTGTCKSGVQICEQGQWGACTGEVPPTPEICDDNLDNNCDGVTDEGCSCHYLNLNVGVCNNSLRDGQGLCQKPPDYSETEICGDNLDNNCNGSVDEGCPCDYLDKPLGVCKGLTRTPSGNCPIPSNFNTTEICGDGLDNNCDGVIDEGCPCDYLDKPHGVCKGITRDSSGHCPKPADYSDTEICGNNFDNNCNGIIDEGCECTPNETRLCGSKVGECKYGTQICSASGKWQTECTGEIGPTPEICGDGKDNNCNGVIDEGCPCNYLDKSHGVCKGLTLDATGICPKPANYSDTEICGDGIDNNCNGVIDENCSCNYLDKPHGLCKGLKRDATGICPKPANYSDTEICGDNLDNNCNGVIDEGCPCNYLDKPHGVCKSLQRDATGNCPKPAEYSETEICDGLDNDCNGLPDDNYLQQGQKCTLSGQLGLCSQGEWTCRTGKLNCMAIHQQTTERCRTKLDEDCDGYVDEICGTESVLYALAMPSTTGDIAVIKKHKSISSVKRSRIGNYTIYTTGTNCPNAPMFMTAVNNKLTPMSYICNNDRYDIVAGTASTTPSLVDTGFSVAIPDRSSSSLAWGTINVTACPLPPKACTQPISHGGADVHHIAKGIYEISSSYCNSEKQPYFVSIISDKIEGYGTISYYAQAKCRVMTLDLRGNPADLNFAYWIPNYTIGIKGSLAWAVVSNQKPPNVIVAANNFADQYAKWAAIPVIDANNNFQFMSVSFDSWTEPSAYLISVNSPTAHQVSATIGKTGVQAFPFNITDPKYPQMPKFFAILFLQ